MLSRIALDSQDSYPFFSGYPFFLAAIRFFSNLVKFPISSHFFAFSQFFHFGTSKTKYEPYFHTVFPTSMSTIVPESKQTQEVNGPIQIQVGKKNPLPVEKNPPKVEKIHQRWKKNPPPWPGWPKPNLSLT